MIEVSSYELEELTRLIETRLASLRERRSYDGALLEARASNTLLLLADLLDRHMAGSCSRLGG